MWISLLQININNTSVELKITIDLAPKQTTSISFHFTPARLNLKFEEPIAKEVKLELHSIIGNSLEVESEIVDDHEVRVKVKDLPAGYYLLDVRRSGTEHSAFKFLKR